MKQKSMTNNVIFNVLYTTANLLFPFITSMYVARIIGVGGVGKVAAAQAFASYFVTAATLGLPIYGIREFAKARDNSQDISKMYSEMIVFNMISTIISIIIYIISIRSIPRFQDDLVLHYVCGLQVFFCLFNNDWFYRGLEEYRYILYRSLAIKAVSLVCVFLFIRTKEDYIIYALISGIAIGGNNIINFIHARKFVRFSFKGIKVTRHFAPIVILGISVFLESIYGTVDVMMLDFMKGDYATGIYNYAHKTIILVLTGCTAITTAFMPRLSYYYKNDLLKFRQVLGTGLDVLTFVVFPITVGAFILAPSLMTLLYGPDFLQSSGTLRILTAILLINSYSNIICYQVVICTSHEKSRLPAAIIACIVNIILNFIMIPFFSEKGAAIASVLSEFATNLYLFIKIRKTVSIPINKKACRDAIISSLIMGLVVFLCSRISISRLWMCLISVSAGIVTYIMINVLVRNQTLNLIMSKIGFFRKDESM